MNPPTITCSSVINFNRQSLVCFANVVKEMYIHALQFNEYFSNAKECLQSLTIKMKFSFATDVLPNDNNFVLTTMKSDTKLDA